MKKSILAYSFIALLSVHFAYGQCPVSATAWLDTIKVTESSGQTLPAKAEGLNALVTLHKKCNGQRDSVYAVLIHRLGNVYMRAGNLEKAIRHTQEAVTANRAQSPGAQKPFLAHSYFNLGLCYNTLGLFSESQNYFDSCLHIATQYPEKNFIALLAFEKKAFLYFQMGDYQKAIESATQGILLAQKMNDVLSEALLLMQKAQAQLELNLIEEAEKNILMLIDMLSNGGLELNEFLANGYSVYANLLSRKKDFNAAAGYYRKAHALNEKYGKWEQCSRDLHDLGFLYDKELNDPQHAIACYKRGVALAQQYNDVNQLAALYNNMGLVYWRQRDFNKALQYYQQGLAVLFPGLKDASPYTNPELDDLQSNTNDHFVSTLLSNKAESLLELYKKEKNNAALHTASLTYKLADKMVDQMRWKQQGERSRMYWRERTRKWYENAIETCYLLGDTESAFFFFEKSRAVLLNDKLSELGARMYLAPADAAKEQELRIRKFSLEEELATLPVDSQPYNAVAEELFRTKKALEDFIKSLERNYPAYYQYKYDTTVHTTHDIREVLSKNQRSLIEYFTAHDFVYVMAITPDAVIFKKLPYRQYQHDARELLALCANKGMLNRNYRRYRALASTLYDSLVRPLPITTPGVVISQDEHFIPFELLLTDKEDNTGFMIKKYAISYTYSASFMMKNYAHLESLDNTLLGVAPVDYSLTRKLQSLAGADESLNAIESYFASATVLVKDKATKQRFLKNLPEYTVVHLYSHAEADSPGMEPAIYFYDSALHVSELATLGSLQTKLIVLSACETGTGRHVRGEGIFSLARGFAAAGIPSTVTTLWQIDNQATYRLTELFYKYLHLGFAGDEALQQAKLEFLQNSDKEYELPYYWASTVLIGQTGSMEEEVISEKTLWIAGLVFVAVMLIGYVVVRRRR